MHERMLHDLQQLLGREHVLSGDADLQRYGWCTTPIRRRILAAVRPGSVEDVQGVVRLAVAHQTPIYPISSGHNWGYGSAQPARDHNVVVDLGRMNRISHVDRELAYAVLEPGVTQQQLYDYLQQQRIPLWLNPTGAGPTCSILGNTLERGFGIGPNGDHFLAQCGMEVVLATGEILRTGFGHYPGAKAAYAYKWGVGPYLDGLFTQASNGIVTKMGVWLMRQPEHFEACYLTCYAEEQLDPLIAGVRHLLANGVFTGPVNLLHRNRVLIMLGRYPWTEMGGRTPLDESLAQRLAGQKRIGAWNGVGALCGSRAQVQAAKRTIAATLKGKVDRLTFLSDSKLQTMGRFPKLAGTLLRMNVPDLLKTLRGSYGMMKGIPSDIALSLAYWRNKRPMPPAGDLDPARDGCGLMWFAPIIPMTARDVAAFRRVIEPIFARYRLEACMTLTAINERAFDCTLPILFDKDDAAEAQNALECYQALIDGCRREGYFAYRLGIQSMESETAADADVFWRVAARLKKALDPQGIVAPGRYVG